MRMTQHDPAGPRASPMAAIVATAYHQAITKSAISTSMATDWYR